MNHKIRTFNPGSHSIRSAILTLLAAVSVFCQTEKAPQRIVFARGATTARASGYLRGRRDSASFVLRATAGQHMRVELDARGAIHGGVFYPSGKGEIQPGGVIFDDTIDETGDYMIVVSESQMGDEWRGNFTVRIEILPKARSIPESPDYQRYVGKYPNDLFRAVPLIKTRLRQLLGANYPAFNDRMQVQTPIEKDEDTIVMRGCMAHLCTIDEAILVIDLNDGTPYVALKFESKFRPIFAGDKSRIPQSLRRAMNAQ